MRSALLSASRDATRRLLPVTPRFIDEAECVLSVLLAIAFAHLLQAQNVAWAAFSGYMVMRGHVSDSLLRGALRILGTAVGAGLALLVSPVVQGSVAASVLACAVLGGVSLYGALTGQRAYAWLFAGLTFEMILLDTLAHPGLDIRGFAATRLLEVAAGTAACVGVSAVSTLTVRRRWPGTRAAPARRIGWHPHALRHAVQGAAALALLPVLWARFAVPELAQSAVAVMAVMLVPVSSIGPSGLVPVSRKLLQRVVGCLAGSALAGAFLFAAHGSPVLLLTGTVVGVLLGRHIENGGHTVTYVGTQFTLAVLVTLVPDSYAGIAITPALERLTGTLVGLALLEPVLIAWHLVAPAGAARTQPAGGGTGMGR